MLSGTVAQQECVWGQSCGDLRLLAVVPWGFMRTVHQLIEEGARIGDATTDYDQNKE